jgi:hypothetical protein
MPRDRCRANAEVDRDRCAREASRSSRRCAVRIAIARRCRRARRAPRSPLRHRTRSILCLAASRPVARAFSGDAKRRKGHFRDSRGNFQKFVAADPRSNLRAGVAQIFSRVMQPRIIARSPIAIRRSSGLWPPIVAPLVSMSCDDDRESRRDPDRPRPRSIAMSRWIMTARALSEPPFRGAGVKPALRRGAPSPAGRDA